VHEPAERTVAARSDDQQIYRSAVECEFLGGISVGNVRGDVPAGDPFASFGEVTVDPLVGRTGSTQPSCGEIDRLERRDPRTKLAAELEQFSGGRALGQRELRAHGTRPGIPAVHMRQREIAVPGKQFSGERDRVAPAGTSVDPHYDIAKHLIFSLGRDVMPMVTRRARLQHP
jgi:hypothetical protein